MNEFTILGVLTCVCAFIIVVTITYVLVSSFIKAKKEIKQLLVENNKQIQDKKIQLELINQTIDNLNQKLANSIDEYESK